MRPPLCDPSRAARRGQFGSVIAEIEIEDGQVSNVDILASIPVQGFRNLAKETVLQWGWIADDVQPEPDCRMSRTNIILPIVFALD
ncbi:MAG: energy transducer TonB [Pseudomonadota bacterium]